jgi:hypothetical protein
MAPNSSSLDVSKILAGKADLLQPEYANVRTAVVLFGLSRTELWRLMDDGIIEWIHYKTDPKAEKGIRLIHLASLRNYIKSFSK